MTDEIEIDETVQRRVVYRKSPIATPVKHIKEGQWLIENGFIWCLTEVEDSPTTPKYTSWKNEAMNGRQRIEVLESVVARMTLKAESSKKTIEREQMYRLESDRKYRELADGVKKLCI